MTDDFIKWPCDKIRGNSRGFVEAFEGDGVVLSRPISFGKTVYPQLSPCLITQKGCGIGVVVRGDLNE